MKIETVRPPKKERNLAQSYAESQRNVTVQTRHQNFDYTTIADRLRTVSWSNDNYPTSVIKLVNGSLSSH